MEFFQRYPGLRLTSRSPRRSMSRDAACLHFEVHLFEKQIGNQPPQPRVFKLKFGNSCLLCLIDSARTVRLRLQLPPTMQGHDAHAERVRNLALRLSLRRYIIRLCELARDLSLRVLFRHRPSSPSSLVANASFACRECHVSESIQPEPLSKKLFLSRKCCGRDTPGHHSGAARNLVVL